MAEMSSPFDKEDDSENAGLMGNQKTDNKYEGGVLKRHWPVLLTAVGVLALILVGVAIGAVFNAKEKNASRLARNENYPYKEIRLPGNVIPLRYRLYLHPQITDNNNVRRKFNYSGNVRILIEVKEKTDNIILHSRGLNITSKKLYSGENAMDPSTENNAPKIGLDDEHLQSTKLEQLMIRLDENEELDVGKYVLYLHFTGDISTSLEGFYNSSYKTQAGETRYLATTHFEPTHARTAFPCFDEPAMKANFTIIIVRRPEHVALSNMPVRNTSDRTDGLKTDHFKPSVRMSTYLVAFVVCDYVNLTKITPRGTVVSVWAPAEQIDQAQFAIEVAPKVLAYYEEFFKVNFPLPKQDLIAIPDFGAGAMENWGLITYRLTSILYDENQSSSANKQWVAVVIAHELAHQWFGNLVTMEWWNDLWLNEGFAAFVEFIGADVADPTWQMMDQFIVDDTQSSLTLDSHCNSHPISVTVNDPAEINQIFDTISYDKGASIIRMMKNFTGSEAFHTGLASYLNEYKFRNAKSDDLWRSMTEALSEEKRSKFDVKNVMDTWTLQMGYPVLDIKKDGDKITLTQKHFLVDSDCNPKVSVYGYKWDVPVTYFTNTQNISKITWFKRNQSSIDITLDTGNKWYKLNSNQIGFYRVNYENKNWNALKEQLMTDHLVLSTSDRANLLDDVFELAKADQLDQVYALNMTEYLTKEVEYVPWITGLSSVAYIGEMLQGRSGYSDYEKYLIKQVKPLVQRLKFEDTGPHLDKYLRGSALRSAVAHNDSETVTEAMKIFNDFRVNNVAIPPNLRSAVYLAGIKYGGRTEWDFMFNIYKTTKYPSEQRKIMFSLTETNSPTILKSYLDMTLDSSQIRSQDSCGVIEHISMNPKGYKMAYAFVLKNWEQIFKRYGHSSFDISSLIKTIFGRGKTEKCLNKAKEFINGHDLGSGTLAGKQALAGIKNHINWLDKNEVKVVEWLKSKVEKK